MLAQTAGEQRYYDFAEERIKSIRIGMIIWISTLAAAFIAGTADLTLGIILGVVGIILAVRNIKSQKSLNSKLAVVSDKAVFYNQLVEKDTVEVAEFRLILTRDYALVYRNDVFIYKLSEMDKVEVSVQKESNYSYKRLYLTDKKGVRHVLADCPLKSNLENAFDQAYITLVERIHY